MKYPLIGITTSIDMQEGTYCSKSSYAACISQAGGIPVLLPADECIGREGNYVKRLDGILFAGGGDIHPHFWGEEPLDGFEMGNILPQRDSFEIRLCQIAEERRLPMLGICRGIQIMAAVSIRILIQGCSSAHLACGICRRRRTGVRHIKFNLYLTRGWLRSITHRRFW